MGSRTRRVIGRTSYDFGGLSAGATQTVTLDQRIDASGFGSATVLARTHALTIGAGSGGYVRVDVRADGFTHDDPAMTFEGPVLCSVLVGAEGVSAPRFSTDTFPVSASMLKVELTATQDGTTPAALEVTISIDLVLEDSTRYDPALKRGVVLDLWAEANTVANTVASGSEVSAWMDRVHGALFTDGGVSTRRPAWVASWQSGKPALDFDGSSDALQVTLATDELLGDGEDATLVLYGGLDANSGGTDNGVLDGQSQRVWFLFNTAEAGRPMGWFEGGTYKGVGVQASTGAHAWVWSSKSGGSSSGYEDGSPLGSAATLGALAGLGGQMAVGSVYNASGQFLDGKIGRLLLYRGLLDADAIARLAAWGRDHYALP